MGQYGVKATAPGLICRGYRFKPTPHVNECERAQCVACGFHYAENPLDCLSYYPRFDAAEFWLVYGDGDIHETFGDSKIACTRIEFLRRLDMVSFLIECLRYIHDHPRRPLHHLIRKASGAVEGVNRFVIVVGSEPVAKGAQEGDVLCLLKRGTRPQLDEFGIFTVGTEGILPGQYYDVRGIAAGSPRRERGTT